MFTTIPWNAQFHTFHSCEIAMIGVLTGVYHIQNDRLSVHGLFRSVRTSCTTFDWPVCPPVCKNFFSFSFSSLCPVTPGHPCHLGDPPPVTPVVVVVVSSSWRRHDFDDDVNNIGDNDDHDLFTSHDQEEKEGAGGGLQFPTWLADLGGASARCQTRQRPIHHVLFSTFVKDGNTIEIMSL